MGVLFTLIYDNCEKVKGNVGKEVAIKTDVIHTYAYITAENC